MSRLRTVFMGTPDFAVPVLDALLAAGHEVVRVYTRPPARSGRGRAARPSPVQRRAERAGIEIGHPAGLRGPGAGAEMASAGADAAVVAAYGALLPPPVLEAPPLGCLNVHASLLPRWRGAAPIQRAILAGDATSGVTVMKMDEGLDTGPVLARAPLDLPPDIDAGALHDRLAALGAGLLVRALEDYAAGRAALRPQPERGATWAPKIDRAETRIDWRLAAPALDRQVRAFSPRPGAWFEAGGERVRVLAAHVASPAAGGAGARPGTVLDDRAAVACGAGALRLDRLQRAGKAPMAAAEFLRGFPLSPGGLLAGAP